VSRDPTAKRPRRPRNSSHLIAIPVAAGHFRFDTFIGPREPRSAGLQHEFRRRCQQ
jgi:hypothetical protein